MCKFKSGIVTRSGEIYTHWNTDSHEEIVSYYGLNDKGLDYLVRVEYSPEDLKDLADVSKYILRVDENSIPAWFEEQRERVENEMRHIIERMIKTGGDIDLILDGEYILSGNSKIKKIKGGRILSISDNAQVKSIFGNAQVESISGNAQVESISGNAQVESISENAQVKSICDNAQVKYIFDNAQVKYDERAK